MKARVLLPLVTVAVLCSTFFAPKVQATSNHNYKPGEYVVIVQGRSPNGRYSIASHGDGELGYDNFHLYLMDAKTGRKIGPLEEIKDTLDTGASAFYAQWSADSKRVSITYRIDRHVAVKVVYSIKNRRAYLENRPTRVSSLR
jgi:hypothetical protein